MDGIKIGQEIRKLSLPRDPALAAYSELTTLKVRQECARAGFDHFLAKPAAEYHLDQLTKLVRIAAGKASEFEAMTTRFQQQVCKFTIGQVEFCKLVLDSLPFQTDKVKRQHQVARLYRTITRAEAWLVNHRGLPLALTVQLERDIAQLRTSLSASQSGEA